MPSAVIGANGFIGSALMRYSQKYLEEEYIGINRENSSNWKGYHFKNLIWAAGLSSKIICEQDRQLCWNENSGALAKALSQFPCDKFIYISSAAIYPDSFSAHQEKESISADFKPPSWYGYCKFDGEKLVKELSSDWLCLRPNGFVGLGLKKNVVYDLTRPEPKLFMSWDSRLQFTHTDFFAHLCFNLSSKYSREVINIAPEGFITPAEIAVALRIDMKAVEMPKGIIVPKVSTILNVSKLQGLIDFPLQSDIYAILNWNNGI